MSSHDTPIYVDKTVNPRSLGDNLTEVKVVTNITIVSLELSFVDNSPIGLVFFFQFFASKTISSRTFVEYLKLFLPPSFFPSLPSTLLLISTQTDESILKIVAFLESFPNFRRFPYKYDKRLWS